MIQPEALAYDIRTPTQLVTTHLTPINVGYSAIIYSPINPWEILRGDFGKWKKKRTHAIEAGPRKRVVTIADRICCYWP